MYKHFDELSDNEINELSQNYADELYDCGELDEILGIENANPLTDFALIPKHVLREHYDGVLFVEEDFFCNLNPTNECEYPTYLLEDIKEHNIKFSVGDKFIIVDDCDNKYFVKAFYFEDDYHINPNIVGGYNVYLMDGTTFLGTISELSQNSLYDLFEVSNIEDYI